MFAILRSTVLSGGGEGEVCRCYCVPVLFLRFLLFLPYYTTFLFGVEAKECRADNVKLAPCQRKRFSSLFAIFSGWKFHRPASDGNDRVWDAGLLPSLRLRYLNVFFFLILQRLW